MPFSSDRAPRGVDDDGRTARTRTLQWNQERDQLHQGPGRDALGGFVLRLPVVSIQGHAHVPWTRGGARLLRGQGDPHRPHTLSKPPTATPRAKQRPLRPKAPSVASLHCSTLASAGDTPSSNSDLVSALCRRGSGLSMRGRRLLCTRLLDLC